jgi:hypothetical protein
MKAFRASGCIAPPFLILELHVGECLTPRPAPEQPGKHAVILLHMRLSGFRKPVRAFGQEKNLFQLPGFETRIVNPVA